MGRQFERVSRLRRQIQDDEQAFVEALDVVVDQNPLGQSRIGSGLSPAILDDEAGDGAASVVPRGQPQGDGGGIDVVEVA